MKSLRRRAARKGLPAVVAAGLLLSGADSRERPKDGSGIAIKDLSGNQVRNLATLGKVWGFLKYHHPQAVWGRRDWDRELFRVLPRVLAAPDRATANAALLEWIDGMGPVVPCRPCARLDENDIHLSPRMDWLGDESRLGPALSMRLRSIHDNRPVAGSQHYVSLALFVGNPSFDHEPAYQDLKFPDMGFQLLGLYRYWNIIEYWFPYRDVIGEDWDKILFDFIPDFALAKDFASYERAIMTLAANAHDGHSGLWSSVRPQPPVGACRLPIFLRFIEGQPVVVGFPADEPEGVAELQAAGLRIGDAIAGLDGEPVDKLVKAWRPYYSASNESSLLRDIAGSMSRGACGQTSLRIRREGLEMKLPAKRVPIGGRDWNRSSNDLPGPSFRLLSSEVAYLKLSTAKKAEIARSIEAASRTKGLIIDIRNYPSEFMVFELGGHLVDKETPFARFTQGDLSNPGAFHWTQPVSLSPRRPRYEGKVAILVDEMSQSQAEYTAMALRAAPGALVVGGATAGADGNVSPFALPGGLRTAISGIGVFYPDKKPTQRIGIIPDIEARPTIEGIRAGRDEVLEEALRQILGKEAPTEKIQKMAGR